MQRFGIGVFTYTKDWYGMADRDVLLVGLLLLLSAAVLRIADEGAGGLAEAKYMKAGGMRRSMVSSGLRWLSEGSWVFYVHRTMGCVRYAFERDHTDKGISP